MKSEKDNQKLIERTLNRLEARRESPLHVYIILLVMYLVTTVTVSMTASSHAEVMVCGMPIPVYSFAGVLSVLSEICVMFMTIYCGKKGFKTALTLLVIQIPVVVMGIIRQHNLTSLPGLFGNFLAIIAICVIYVNNKKVNAYQKELRDQAVTDQLTGIPNRFACSKLLSALIEKKEKFAVVSIDLNGFKGINDTMGFKTGNEVLKEVASRWKKIADSGLSETLDFITRISSDEFILVIRNYQSDKDIMNTIVQYEAALNNRITIDNCDLYISASFGYAEYPQDASTKDSLVTYASAAMHEVKRAGGSDHILRFTPDILKIERTIELESKIRDALKNETLFFNLQPQFDMDHRLRGFEALARMKDADGTVISPGEFIPAAEKVGLIDKVDEMVFRKSAKFFGDLIRRTGMDITLSINISVRHLMKNGFIDEVKEIMNSTGIEAKNLEIEITESIMIDSVDKALQCIDELKAIGIKIAIDDFGTGYSSLSYLNRFPADLLKIDKSFIDKMNLNESSRQYVSAIISMGHIMGFEVISEGVEEENQIDTLREIGCDFIQGFIWGRPLMPDAAEELVISQSQK